MFPPFPHGGLCPWTSLEFSHDLGYSTPKLAIPNSFSVSAYVINNSDCMWKNNCLHPTTEEVNAIARDVCLSVCLLARLLRNACMHGFGWHFCLSTGVGTWTNWSTFEPDPDHSPDAGTALLSPILYALQPGMLLRPENPTYMYWAWLFAAYRSSDTWFWRVETPLSEVNALYGVPF